jgi:hypothetical protein
MYIHSWCCNAHWELVINGDNSLAVVCEECGAFGAIIPGLYRKDGTQMIFRHDQCQCEVCKHET